MTYAVSVSFNTSRLDKERIQKTLESLFGARDVKIVAEISSPQFAAALERGDSVPRRGTEELLRVAQEKIVFRWGDVARLTNARAALVELLADGAIFRVRHGVFGLTGAPQVQELAAKLRPRRELGPRQQLVFDALAEPKTARELKDLSGVSRQAIDQLLKKLLKQKLVQRFSTDGESTEWYYVQATKRRADVSLLREPTLSPIQAKILNLMPPAGPVALKDLAREVPSYAPALKRLVLKRLVERGGGTKRNVLRLTGAGLQHSRYEEGQASAFDQ
jgi:DNA-binding MarR family transcriptional regulator